MCSLASPARATRSPDLVQAAASRTIRCLYFAENRRRCDQRQFLLPTGRFSCR